MEDPLILSFNSIDEVIKNQLYIGDLGSARGIHRGRNPQNITHVLSICPDYSSDNGTHLTISVDDSEISDLLIELPAACKFIDEAISGGGRVLVHCVMGISRSATTVCAYLMKKRGLTPQEALARVRDARPQVSPNDGFMKQLALFQRCNCAPSPDHPVYREFKEQLKADAIRFINDFIDVYPYEEEKIFFCSDLPYNIQQTELLMDCYGISHLLTIRPAESTARDLSNANCLHIELDDDFEKDDLLLHMDCMLSHIKSAITAGTGVLIHSFQESHVRLPFAAYLMDRKRIPCDAAINITLKVKEVFEEDMDEMKDYVVPRLKLFDRCHFTIDKEDSRVQEFMKHRD